MSTVVIVEIVATSIAVYANVGAFIHKYPEAKAGYK